MKVEQVIWSKENGWSSLSDDFPNEQAQLIFIFANRFVMGYKDLFDFLSKRYPSAYKIGCSTSGEICDTHVLDESLVATAVYFDKTFIKMASVDLAGGKDSFTAGKELAQALIPNELQHVFVLSDGLKVNGSRLVEGLSRHLDKNVGITGGLAGDADRFEETLICSGDIPKKELISVVGFYGSHLKISFGSMGGFSPFGPERKITRADGNILYELDGRSALDLYKEYLGEELSRDLATNLFLFPLSFRTDGSESPVVRTILSINEQENSMTFAGDMFEGGYARLMKTNINKLVDGALQAAQTSFDNMAEQTPDLAILISCMGRKIIMKQRIEEETEVIRDIFGEKTVLAGFYSYGEIAHFSPLEPCNLHNQTMTITAFRED